MGRRKYTSSPNTAEDYSLQLANQSDSGDRPANNTTRLPSKPGGGGGGIPSQRIPFSIPEEVREGAEGAHGRGKMRKGIEIGDGTVLRNILVTGGCGFIGSHVVVRLLREYGEAIELYNLDILDYCASMENVREVAHLSNYHFIRGDIGSIDLVNYILKEHHIDTILHFAAQTHVDNSFGNSLSFTSTNVTGTHVLLESARLHNHLRRFIHVSTDEVYGESHQDEQQANTEEAVLRPTNPYSASKAGGELLVQSYMKSFHFPAIITRGNNVYGPHQFPEKLVPKFICLLEQGKKCCLHGTGENQRSFLYVDDVAAAFQRILTHGKIGETYNIGTDFEISNRAVAESLIRLYRGPRAVVEDHIEYVEDRLYNDTRYRISSEKIHELGWRPRVGWEEGLKKTIAWYKDCRFRYFKSEELQAALVAHPNEGRKSDFGLFRF
eukprot:Nk52_evm11s2568 gene=Nk52_evmTU11s2568